MELLKESCGNMLFHEVEVVGLNLLTPYVHWDFFPFVTCTNFKANLTIHNNHMKVTYQLHASYSVIYNIFTFYNFLREN